MNNCAAYLLILGACLYVSDDVCLSEPEEGTGNEKPLIKKL